MDTEPFFFFPDPKTNAIYMLWERELLVCRIYLTNQHSEHVTPSWFGELIGRYEGGALVVDTIGLKTGLSFLHVPHAAQREAARDRAFQASDDGKLLEVAVKVEDPDTLNEPMYMTTRWRKQERAWREFICAENNADRFSHNLFPLPEAKTPDF